MYDVLPDLMKAVLVLVAVSLAIGAIIGYGIRDFLACMDGPQETTSGAAYDAMEDREPVTECDMEAVKKLLNSW